MKLQILSDLHLEFTKMTVQESDADVIVLPGDIWKGDGGIYWARSTWPDKPIVYDAFDPKLIIEIDTKPTKEMESNNEPKKHKKT